MTTSSLPEQPGAAADASPPRRLGLNPAKPSRAVRRRATILIALAVAAPQLTLAIILAFALDMMPDRGTLARAGAPPASRPLTAGDCVRADPDREQYYIPVGCSSPRVTGRVTGVVTGPRQATEACPDDTDFFASGAGSVICLRRAGDPHSGDPGLGGGVFRRGDCVLADGMASPAPTPSPGGRASAATATAGVREIPCASPAVFATVTARARSAAGCRAPAVRFATLSTGPRPVLCLGDGPGLASAGECIADPQRPPVTFEAVPCADAAAKAVVLGRVAAPKQCLRRPGHTHYVEDPSGLPASAVVCLATLR